MVVNKPSTPLLDGHKMSFLLSEGINRSSSALEFHVSYTIMASSVEWPVTAAAAAAAVPVPVDPYQQT